MTASVHQTLFQKLKLQLKLQLADQTQLKKEGQGKEWGGRVDNCEVVFSVMQLNKKKESSAGVFF